MIIAKNAAVPLNAQLQADARHLEQAYMLAELIWFALAVAGRSRPSLQGMEKPAAQALPAIAGLRVKSQRPAQPGAALPLSAQHPAAVLKMEPPYRAVDMTLIAQADNGYRGQHLEHSLHKEEKPATFQEPV
jgi:hypothetical protein